MSAPIDPRDPRVYLAGERTLLAWVRTSLALMGLGFVVARFGLFLNEIARLQQDDMIHSGGFSLALGTAMILLGVIVLFLSAMQHWRTLGRIERGESMPMPRLSGAVMISGILTILGLGLATYLVLAR